MRNITMLDIDLAELPGDARAIASAIKERVRAATGLTCSIAVARGQTLELF